MELHFAHINLNYNISSTDNIYVYHTAHFITSTALGIQGILGLCINLMMLAFLASDHKNLCPADFLIANICLSDSLICVCDVFQMYFILNTDSIGCKIVGFFQYVMAATSYIFPSLAMVNRWGRLFDFLIKFSESHF